MNVDPNLKKKKDEEASQIWASIDPKARQCKKCMWAAEDTEYTVGVEMAYCDIFPMPDGKPRGVLDDKVECEAFIDGSEV